MSNKYINKNKMKKNLKKVTLLTLSSMFILNASFAQSTLEWTYRDGSNTATTGPTTNPVVVTFLKDALNAPANTVFSTNTPALTATVSFRSQQRSSTLTGSSVVLPGLTFGGRNSESEAIPAGVQVVNSAEVYNVFGANIPVQPPKNTMYTSSPSATPVSATDNLGNPVGALSSGFDVEALTGATNTVGLDDVNAGISIYSSVDPLFKANEDKAGRFYYGEIVIKFNRPVKNPVVHIGGLGGSYNFQPRTPAGADRQITYFTTELELQNNSLTSTFMAGNPNFDIPSGTNNILNSAIKPNAGSWSGI